MSEAARAIGGVFGGGGDQRGFGAGGGPDFGKEYGTARKDMAKLYDPYTKAGAGALGDLQGMLSEGFNPGDLTQDPGYQFQLEQGNRAVQQQGGLQGSPFGGNVMQEMAQFNQGLAATTYNNAFNRWQTQVQNLAGLAGMGANAAQSQAGNLTQLFGAKSGAEANIYGSQAGVEGSRVGRGGSFFGAASNFFGL